MKEIINALITSITTIYVGFISGLILDTNIFDDVYQHTNQRKESHSNTNPVEKVLTNNRSTIRAIAAMMPEFPKKLPSSRCNLDESKGCGGCVSD